MTQRKKRGPKGPHPFKYHAADDPALLAEWHRRGMLTCIVRGDLVRDGSTVYERAYTTGKMVAVAVGRTKRAVDEWAADGKFIPARLINGRRMWAVEDLDRLLRGGVFFEQSPFDKGHPGELAARAREGVSAVEAERREAARKGAKRTLPGLPKPRKVMA